MSPEDKEKLSTLGDMASPSPHRMSELPEDIKATRKSTPERHAIAKGTRDEKGLPLAPGFKRTGFKAGDFSWDKTRNSNNVDSNTRHEANDGTGLNKLSKLETEGHASGQMTEGQLVQETEDDILHTSSDVDSGISLESKPSDVGSDSGSITHPETTTTPTLMAQQPPSGSPININGSVDELGSYTLKNVAASKKRKHQGNSNVIAEKFPFSYPNPVQCENSTVIQQCSTVTPHVESMKQRSSSTGDSNGIPSNSSSTTSSNTHHPGQGVMSSETIISSSKGTTVNNLRGFPSELMGNTRSCEDSSQGYLDSHHPLQQQQQLYSPPNQGLFINGHTGRSLLNYSPNSTVEQKEKYELRNSVAGVYSHPCHGGGGNSMNTTSGSPPGSQNPQLTSQQQPTADQLLQNHHQLQHSFVMSSNTFGSHQEASMISRQYNNYNNLSIANNNSTCNNTRQWFDLEGGGYYQANDNSALTFGSPDNTRGGNNNPLSLYQHTNQADYVGAYYSTRSLNTGFEERQVDLTLNHCGAEETSGCYGGAKAGKTTTASYIDPPQADYFTQITMAGRDIIESDLLAPDFPHIPDITGTWAHGRTTAYVSHGLTSHSLVLWRHIKV